MAFASSGSVSSLISNCAWSGCRTSRRCRRARPCRRAPRACRRLEPGQRVDLDQRGVLLDEDLVERLDHRRRPARRPPRGTSASVAISRAFASSTPVPGSIGICLTASGLVLATSSISTPPSTRRDAEVLAVGAVEQEGEVVLLLRRRRRGDQHPVDRQALDLHPEDVRRRARTASSGVLASLTPPALPRPPALTCALTTQTPSSSAAARASSGVVTTMPRVRGDAVLGEEFLRLVLHQVHVPHPSPG